MKRLIIALPALIALTFWFNGTAAHAQQLSLGQITKYLNSMRAAQAKFVQANPDKTLAQGVLYIQKPGKIRYEYTTPADSLVISDGRMLGVFDKKSNRGPQRYDLKRTPLDILLNNSINLEAAGVVRNISSDGVKTQVIATDPQNPKAGTITMVFTANPTELRQWIVTDRSGKNTTVILNDLKVRNSVSADLFDIRKTEAALKR